jgi:hypothetical protein
MTQQPQPSPNTPAPSLSESALHSRRYWSWIWLAMVIFILGWFVLASVAVRPRNHDSWERPFKSVRSLGLALFEFENEFGQPPGESTIEPVRSRGTSLSFGVTTSNDFFRQLIAAGLVQDEKLFFIPAKGYPEPDNRRDGTHALEKGECGFSYMVGPSSSFGSPRPIIVTPLISGTNRFDPKPFGGWAIVLWTDSRVVKLPINETGQVMHLGKHLLDPGNPIWEGRPPVIAWPE